MPQQAWYDPTTQTYHDENGGTYSGAQYAGMTPNRAPQAAPQPPGPAIQPPPQNAGAPPVPGSTTSGQGINEMVGGPPPPPGGTGQQQVGLSSQGIFGGAPASLPQPMTRYNPRGMGRLQPAGPSPQGSSSIQAFQPSGSSYNAALSSSGPMGADYYRQQVQSGAMTQEQAQYQQARQMGWMSPNDPRGMPGAGGAPGAGYAGGYGQQQPGYGAALQTPAMGMRQQPMMGGSLPRYRSMFNPGAQQQTDANTAPTPPPAPPATSTTPATDTEAPNRNAPKNPAVARI